MTIFWNTDCEYPLDLGPETFSILDFGIFHIYHKTSDLGPMVGHEIHLGFRASVYSPEVILYNILRAPAF